jgi:hypothetical protein
VPYGRCFYCVFRRFLLSGSAAMAAEMRDRFRREWLQHLCNEQRSGAGDLYRELFRLDLGRLDANRELHHDDPSWVLRRADLRHRAR